jgi:hypothetical protein
VWFPASYSLDRIVKSLYVDEYRLMWDNTLLEKVKREKTSHANVDLVYFRFKKFIIFSPKEYTDKQIIFADGDVIYTFRTTN